MPTPVYDYIPQYGVEPFDTTKGAEGGAIRTNQNLVVSVWKLSAKSPGGGQPPFAYNGIVIPRSASEGVPETQQVAFRQGMSGRTGAHLYFRDSTTALDDMLAVLNPPEELKQQLAGSVVYNGGSPFDVASYEFSKSQQGQFAWRMEAGEGTVDEAQGTWDGQAHGIIGAYLDLNLFAQPDPGYYPLLKTDGADGVAPLAFDMSTADGVRECIAAVNAGEFYIPCLFANLSDLNGSYRRISWASSTDRG